MNSVRGAEQANAGLLCPQYHVTGEHNWINDPNGPIHVDGTYHLFFQANPDAPRWGPPHWGHVSSRDLVRWRRHPIALSPSPGGPDADGCWSGCTRVLDGHVHLYYTGVVGDDDERVESICRASSSDLVEWTKDPLNPLVAGPAETVGSGYHRDPFLWRDSAGWHLLLGSGTLGDDRHGTAVRYHSPDGVSWTYGGVFFEAPRFIDGLDLGQHWECPQLLRFGDRWVLLIGCQDPGAVRPLMRVVYFVGVVQGGVFSAEAHGVVDHGDVFYAPAGFADESGRTLIWGWLQERVSAEMQESMDKVGALSLPRVLSLENDELVVSLAPEVAGLRWRLLGDARESGAVGRACRQLEVLFEVTGQGLVRVGLDPDGSDELCVDACGGLVRISGVCGPFEVPSGGGPLEIRVFLDGSAVEVFIAERFAVSTRVYPAAAELGEITVNRRDGEIRCRAWELLGNVFVDD